MRQTVGALNRTWLAIIGLIGLLLGLAGLLFATGLANQLAQALGLNTQLAQPAEPAVPVDLQTVLEPQPVAIITAVVGILLGLLALAWVIAQIPRRNQARPLRLHEDGADGLIICEPNVLTRAVENQIEDFPGVIDADAVLRGTASAPELTVNVTVDDRADVQEVIDRVHNDAAADLETALETPLRRLGVLVDVSIKRKSDKAVVL